MGFFDFLKKGEEPLQKYNDDILGGLVWDDDAESWFGSYNGFSFSIVYDREESPDKVLIAYARDILSNTD